MSTDANLNDFLPSAPWANLRLRSDCLKQLRCFFAARGFLEVDTPLLSADTVVDRFIEPIKVSLPDSEGSAPTKGMFLQTSPEFAMKRLLAAGADAIYQVAHAFRASEQGPWHNPEFTMVEWYRVGDNYEAGMSLLETVAEELLETPACQRLSYQSAFETFAEIEPFSAGHKDLVAVLESRRISIPQSLDRDDRDQLLNLLLAELIEPNLGNEVPVILYDYPASQAALAKVREDDVPVAERFELYFRGVELANGYHELLDADVLMQRNRSINDQRARDNRARLPEKSRLIRAMEQGFPPCCGVALGFDRLVMMRAGVESIDRVIAFPIDRA